MTTHFIDKQLWKGDTPVHSTTMCGMIKRNFYWGDNTNRYTKDPREVDCDKCKSSMKDYKKNMMLSLLMQDFGTPECSDRFK